MTDHMRSLAQIAELTCPQCQHSFPAEVWLVVDAVERPDLLERILQKTLHHQPCPKCGIPGQVDAPLLLFRPDKLSPGIFSPAHRTTQEQNREQLGGFIGYLQKQLGDAWQAEWLEQFVFVPRNVLPTFLRDGREAAPAEWESQQALNQVANHEQEKNQATLDQVLQELDQPARLQDMPRRIKLCRHALEHIQREEQPELWAALQNELANSLAQNPHGERVANLEQAIARYQAALEVRTRTAFPEQWATIQNNLANAYGDRIAGERVANLEQAIVHYQAALEVYTRTAFPEDWAMTQDNLATAYSNRIAGERAANLEKAIARYQAALEVRTRTAFPEQWAMTQNNLANAYNDRIAGERAANLEQAIAHCLAALEVYTRTAFPEQWAMTQNNLATAYNDRIAGERAANLEQAIAHYQAALEVRTRTAFPERWAATQNDLASAYSDRIAGERTANLEQAITHYQAALEVRTRTAFSEQWAMTQNNLATAYSDRIAGERAENLELAIAHYQAALEVYTHTAFPEQWAMTQNNLASAYRKRIAGERAENLEQAIAHYQAALDVYTHIAFPEDWALTQNNLATAYSDRITGERTANLELALAHYLAALEVYTHTAFPEQWAMTQNNLASAYRKRIAGERAANLEQAIAHCQAALEVRTRTAFPQQWAAAQNNLASAYSDRIAGGRTANLELAIAHYQAALEVYTHTAFPEQWAMTQNNLANAYRDRIAGEREGNLEQAIAHFQSALEVFQPSSDPIHSLTTAKLLADLCLKIGRWPTAAEALLLACTADEILFQAALSDPSKQRELHQTGSLYLNAAFALARSGQFKEAVEKIEAGRARKLRDSLERDRHDLQRLPQIGHADLLQRYQAASQAFTALSARSEESHTGETPFDHLVESFIAREATYQSLQTAITDIRAILGYEDFLLSLDHQAIQTLSAALPLVYLAATPHGGLALLVQPKGITPICLDRLTEKAVQEQVVGSPTDHLLGGYLGAYVAWRELPKSASAQEARQAKAGWSTALSQTTRWLWEVGMQKLTHILVEKGIRHAALIPSGLLGLLPLHAACSEDGSVLEQVCFTYLPSAHALKVALEQEDCLPDAILAVDDPSRTLDFSAQEVEAALDYFPKSHWKRLRGQNATKDILMQEMPRFPVLHFSTHGRADFIHPLESSLLLAHDKRLTLAEIMELKLNHARLAVLSACETGIPGTDLPDEVVGLPTGFLQAGVPGVIGSLWSVNDYSTMLLMSRFYEFWRKKEKSIPEALRQAQLWLRDSTGGELAAYLKMSIPGLDTKRMPSSAARPAYYQISRLNPDERPFQHPYYWAGFGFWGI